MILSACRIRCHKALITGKYYRNIKKTQGITRPSLAYPIFLFVSSMCPEQSGSGSSAALYSCTNSVQNSPISQLEPRSSTVSIFLRSSSLAVPPTKPGSKPRPKPWATCAKCASLSRQQNVHWSLPNLVEARDIMQLTDEGSDSILEGRLASCSECVWQDHLASSAKPKKAEQIK